MVSRVASGLNENDDESGQENVFVQEMGSYDGR